MPPTVQGASIEAAVYMIDTLKVCLRLDSWVKEPTNSPLISLAQKHVTKFLATTRRMGAEFMFLALSPSVHGTRPFSRAHESFRASLFKTMALLDFCSRVDKDGDEGALNAVFATLLILNEKQVEFRELRFFVKRILRSHQDCHKILFRWFGPEAVTRDWWWGTGPKPPSARLIYEDIGPEFIEFVENLTSRFAPRYVHNYNTAEDVPYAVDALASPTTGSYGIVRKVVHKESQELFAQKTFQNVFSSFDRKKVLKELGVLELCFHRNIIQLVEAYEAKIEPHSIHIVMDPWAPYTMLEFLRSSDINREARCPWFSPAQSTSEACIYRIMFEIADAVAYLHRLSIKHKDIKPDNILLYQEHTNRVVPIITDVGNSKIYRIGANTDYIKSSYQYLAPEQWEKKESSLKADIWQLGCCFAMILVVARGGTSALDRLWTSFERTDENCSCNIAIEHESFMKTFKEICVPGNLAQKCAHAVSCQMLNLNPSVRCDIEVVRTELESLPKD